MQNNETLPKPQAPAVNPAQIVKDGQQGEKKDVRNPPKGNKNKKDNVNPATLPKPAHLQSQPGTPARDESQRCSAFTVDFNLQESAPFVECSPSMVTLPVIMHNMHLQYAVANRLYNRQFLPEYLVYYGTALAWLRMLNLKDQLGVRLTPEEQDVLRVVGVNTFTVPEPLLLFLKQYGSIQPHSNLHVRPAFPQLPTSVVGPHGGYYGPFGPDTHNLYEEIPCTGVTAEAVRRTVSAAPPGPYLSALNTDQLTATENLLGFAPLGNRLPEAKQLALNTGITADAFPETVPATGFNLPFLGQVSEYLSVQRPFKNHSIQIRSLGVSGQTSQLISLKAAAGANNLYLRTVDINLRARISYRDSVLNTALGMYCGTHIWKRVRYAFNQEWSCALNQLGGVPVPWTLNANSRRETIPAEFRVERFSSTSFEPANYIRQVVERLATHA